MCLEAKCQPPPAAFPPGALLPSRVLNVGDTVPNHASPGRPRPRGLLVLGRAQLSPPGTGDIGLPFQSLR